MAETPSDDLLLWWEGEQIRIATIDGYDPTGEPLYIDPNAEKLWAECAQSADEETP